jgi:hypothetical protein
MQIVTTTPSPQANIAVNDLLQFWQRNDLFISLRNRINERGVDAIFDIPRTSISSISLRQHALTHAIIPQRGTPVHREILVLDKTPIAYGSHELLSREGKLTLDISFKADPAKSYQTIGVSARDLYVARCQKLLAAYEAKHIAIDEIKIDQHQFQWASSGALFYWLLGFRPQGECSPELETLASKATDGERLSDKALEPLMEASKPSLHQTVASWNERHPSPALS